MPADLVARLHDAVVPMLGNAAILDKLAGQAMTPWAATPKELAAALAQEREHFAGLVKASGYVREDA